MSNYLFGVFDESEKQLIQDLNAEVERIDEEIKTAKNEKRKLPVLKKLDEQPFYGLINNYISIDE